MPAFVRGDQGLTYASTVAEFGLGQSRLHPRQSEEVTGDMICRGGW
jgi:hypothetical protein